MDIELDQNLVRQLEKMAQKQQRDVNALVQEAIEQYLTHQAEQEQFRTDVQRIMQEHQWLLDELAKQ